MISEANVDSFDSFDSSNKIIAAMGILKTISTVVLAMEASPDVR